MNKKINLNVEVLRIVYAENKEFLLPLGAIFVSIILLIFFVAPQINGFFQKQNQIVIERGKLANLQESVASLSSVNDSLLDRDLEIVSLALPPNKDFAAILNAISSTASSTGVSLGDFEFQIGDITKTNDQPAGTPSIKISLNISGNVDATAAFIKELKKTIPISQVTEVKSSGNFSAIDIGFYYKPFPPKSTIDPEKIRTASKESQKMIDEIEIPVSLESNTFETPPSVNSSEPL